MNDINMAIYSKRDTLPNVILFNTLGPRQDDRYFADELKWSLNKHDPCLI